MKTRVKWLDRTVIRSPYCIALCTKEADFKHELKRLKVPLSSAPEWIMRGKDATVHYLYSPQGQCCVVCIDKKAKASPLEIVGLLVHEAVHIWQSILEDIGEDRPGHELEAYGIQALAQGLIGAYKI
jgi:hypothetical protein